MARSTSGSRGRPTDRVAVIPLPVPSAITSRLRRNNPPRHVRVEPVWGDELVEAACAQAGLKDFGSDSFREGLDELVASLETEAGLNDLGRAAVESQTIP